MNAYPQTRPGSADKYQRRFVKSLDGASLQLKDTPASQRNSGQTRNIRVTLAIAALTALAGIRAGKDVYLMIETSITLTVGARSLAAYSFDGLLPALDFGDLSDAFFLATEARNAPLLTDALAGADCELSAIFLAALDSCGRRLTSETGEAGVEFHADPILAFGDIDSGTCAIHFTPSVLPASSSAMGQSPPSPAAFTAEPDAKLGPFVLEEKLGEGGFGEVWRARQQHPAERQVALKILKQGLHSSRARARFDLEQAALARLDHPHIARLYEAGMTSDGRPFFAMEWADGTTLNRFWRDGHPPLDQRLELFAQVCRAVEHAHLKGILHRDLKPSNVVVATEGESASAKVIDFGIARALEDPGTDQTLLTRPFDLIGTPVYMSPEQIVASAEADARSDVYSLGVTLYEALCARLPFDPNLPLPKLQRAILDDEPPRPSQRLADPAQSRRLRGDLDWITLKCLEKDPARRYQSVGALLLDIERYAKNEPVEAGSPSAGYRLQKFARRHKTVLATTAAIAVILIAASIISAYSAFRAHDAEIRATKNFTSLQTAHTNLESARQQVERQRDEAVWNQYVARQSPIREAWEQRNFGHLERLLDELAPQPGQPDYRGWEWTYLKDQCDQAFTTIQGRFPTWNPRDGNLAVVRDLEGGGSAMVLVSPIDGSFIRTITETPRNEENRIYNIHWSGDGSRITYLTFRDHVVVLEASSGISIFSQKIPTPKREAPIDRLEVRGLDLSHDGKVLVTGTWAGNIQMWDVDKEQPQKLLQSADNNSHIHAYALRFDPGNHHLVAALRYGRRSTWNIETGERFEYERQSLTASGTVAWNRSGSCFAVTDTDIGSVAIYQLHQTEPLAILPHPSVEGLSWIGDERLVSLGSDQMVRIWDIGMMELVTAFQITAEPDFYRCSPVPDPMGNLLAVPTNGEVKLVKLNEPVKPYTLLNPDASQGSGKRHQIEWDRQGHHIASVQEVMINVNAFETKLRAWDTRSESLRSECDIRILRGLGWSDQSAVRVVELGGRLLEVDIQTGDTTILGTSLEPGREHPSGFSPDGRWLALGLKDGAKCIDEHSRQVASTWSAPDGLETLRSSRWDHSSRLVALLYWNHLVVWDPFGGKVSITPRQEVQFINHAWSPDGHFIAVGCRDGQWVIFDANSLQEIASFSGHRGPVRDIDWSTNGRIASASGDGTVRIWDDATGDELLAFHHPDGRKFLTVRWSTDGRCLAAGDDQGHIFIWGSNEIEPRPRGATGLASGIIARGTSSH